MIHLYNISNKKAMSSTLLLFRMFGARGLKHSSQFGNDENDGNKKEGKHFYF